MFHFEQLEARENPATVDLVGGVIAILVRLWNDDTGAIVSTEYLMVSGIVVAGSSAGLVAIRDAGNRQMQQIAELPSVAIPSQDEMRRQVAMPSMVVVQQNVVVNVAAAQPVILPPSP